MALPYVGTEDKKKMNEVPIQEHGLLHSNPRPEICEYLLIRGIQFRFYI